MNDKRKLAFKQTLTKAKAELKHTWKFHKGSTYQYFFACGSCVLLLFFAAELFRLKVSLDPFLLQFIAVASFGFVAYLSFSKFADNLYEAEQKKEQEVKA